MRNQIVCADTRDYLRTLPDGSVNCCISSPPYYALRDYGVEGQIGLEQTPAEYIANMVAVYREVWRVLRDDGTCFLNIGDTFSGTRRAQVPDNKHVDVGNSLGMDAKAIGIPEKSLMLIPQRLAIALSDDGWIIRNEIIWHKRNPMPQSVDDRWTSAHETVWFMTKSPRYWSDMYAVREEATYAGKTVTLGEKSLSEGQAKGANVNAPGNGPADSVAVGTHRNARDVWSLSSEPFKKSHFAVMPSKLVENCLLVGCPETTCAVCGAPWIRVVEVDGTIIESYSPRSAGNGDRNDAEAPRTRRFLSDHGLRPACTCNADTVPGVVLDPFMGSGTVSRTAIKHRRDFCGCDLNPDYVRMATESLDGLQIALF